MEINVLILGKSGAGKSSLLNYLWGIEKAAIGIGRPVTEKGRTGIHRHDPVKLNGHDLVISDSWGLEADKSDEWLKTVIHTLEKHESSPNVEDWFHTVIYCVGASGARIEPFETREVVSRLQKAGHAVIFALTKADRASSAELAGLRKTIAEDCPANGGVVEIETSHGERRGTLMQPRGRKELIEAITRGLANKLQRKLAVQYLAKCRSLCEEWKSETLLRYDNEKSLFKANSTTKKEVLRLAEVRLRSKLIALEDWLLQAASGLAEFQTAFGASIDAIVRFERVDFYDARVSEVAALGWTDSKIVYSPFFGLIDLPIVVSKMHEILGSVFEDVSRNHLEVGLRWTVEKTVEQLESRIPGQWKTDGLLSG